MLSIANQPPTHRHDASSLLSLAQRSTELRSKAGLRHWLESEVQDFIPHAFVVIAWGDLAGDGASHEVIAVQPELEALLERQVAEQIRPMFGRWIASEGLPVTLRAEELGQPPGGLAWAGDARYVLAHGITDRRGAYDCLYAFFGPEALCGATSQEAARVLLPFIDAGFRQLTFIVDPGEDSAEALAAFTMPAAAPTNTRQVPADSTQELSARELEVMRWVGLGKTNSEIGSILSLSTFTVKNHMRRIYQKLDVMNRAQAVGCLKRLDGPR